MRFVVSPKFGPAALFSSCYGERAVDVSIPARPLSWPAPCRDALTAGGASLCYGGVMATPAGSTRLLFILCDFLRVVKAFHAVKGLLLGFTMSRQSRSPRSSPSTSISAVAKLLAKGTLFWSHRREI